MKRSVTVLWLAFLALTVGLHADDLKATDLARALGVDWWTIEIPATSQERVSLGFCIVFADGRRVMSGSMGFRPGTRVRAFCWPGAKPDLLNVSLVSDTGRLATSLRNPFGAGRIGTYAVPVGKTAKVGEILSKGSTAREITPDQVLKEGDNLFLRTQYFCQKK